MKKIHISSSCGRSSSSGNSSDDETCKSTKSTKSSSSGEEEDVQLEKDDVMSLTSTEVLSTNPLYFMLSKLLKSSSDDSDKNVCDMLSDINANLEKLIKVLQINSNKPPERPAH